MKIPTPVCLRGLSLCTGNVCLQWPHCGGVCDIVITQCRVIIQEENLHEWTSSDDRHSVPLMFVWSDSNNVADHWFYRPISKLIFVISIERFIRNVIILNYWQLNEIFLTEINQIRISKFSWHALIKTHWNLIFLSYTSEKLAQRALFSCKQEGVKDEEEHRVKKLGYSLILASEHIVICV